MGFALETLLAPSYGYSLFTYLLDKLYTQFIENVVRRMTKLCEISTFFGSPNGGNCLKWEKRIMTNTKQKLVEIFNNI